MMSLACKNFIQKASNLYKNYKFDYSEINFKDIYTPIKVICKEHGEFVVTPRSHLKGNMCKHCSCKKFTQFFAKAREKFGDKYKYEYFSDFEFKPTRKMKIICPVHGEFYQTIYNHIRGNGCPKCSYSDESEKSSRGYYEFVKRANKIHQNKYNYESVIYKNNRTKVIIKCPEHGIFYQTPHDHLYGCGCPNCSKKK